MRTAHQRHRDADEAGARDEIELHAVLRTHDRVQRHHAGQRAGNQHGDDDDARFRNARIARRLGREAHGANLVAERRAPDQQPNEQAGRQRQQEGDIERRVAHRVAEYLQQPAELRQLPAFQEDARLRRHGACRLEHVDQQVDHQRGGDEVEHDGGDDDVRAALGLQIGRDERPQRAGYRRTDDRQRKDDPPGQRRVEGQRRQRDAEAADIGLAFAADVEQPAMEGDCHRKAGEDEVGRVIERVADAVAGTEGALHHQHRGAQRVLADEQHHQSRDHEGDQEIDQRDQAVIDPFGQLCIRVCHAYCDASG